MDTDFEVSDRSISLNFEIFTYQSLSNHFHIASIKWSDSSCVKKRLARDACILRVTAVRKERRINGGQ